MSNFSDKLISRWYQKEQEEGKTCLLLGLICFPSQCNVIKNLEKGRKSNIVACNFTFWLGIFTKYRGNVYDTNDFCNPPRAKRTAIVALSLFSSEQQCDLWESCGMPLRDVVLYMCVVISFHGSYEWGNIKFIQGFHLQKKLIF